MQNKKAIDVHGGKDEEGRQVIVWKRHNGANQRWKVVYTDKKPDVVSKGLNKDFGFEMNRPFYIMSRMAMNRVIQSQPNQSLKIKSWTGSN